MKLTSALLFTALLAVPSAASAQDWNDVTEQLLANPYFEDDKITGWTRECNSSTDIQENALEFYNGTFNVYQTIENAPAGRYRFSAQAFYRAGSNDVAYSAHNGGTEALTAVLYAGDDKTALPSVFDYSIDYGDKASGWYSSNGSDWYPNQM